MPELTYALLDQLMVNAAWNGQPSTLLVNQSVGMPQTTNGTMILTATNQATQNNMGQLALTSGGAQPVMLDVPPLANQPSVLMNNWKANNLNVTNISANASTPILVQAVGPGLPGLTPLSLVVGTPLQVGFGQVAQGNTSPQFMQLVIQSNSPTLGIAGWIGGPPDGSGTNGYVVAVNAAQNTGPGTGIAPPQGYYATTTANTYTYSFNWQGAVAFVANLSPSTAQALTFLLRAL